VISTEQDYVLARLEDGRLIALEDDDPLYGRFEEHVLSDAYLRQLVTLFDDTTEAFWATNRLTSFPQTVANKLVVVVNSSQAAVLHDVVVDDEGREVPIELALGLGHEGETDLPHARQQFAPTIAGFLWELMGLPPSSISSVPLDETTEPTVALERGFQVAVQTLHWERRTEEQSLGDEMEEGMDSETGPGRQGLVERNAFRQRFRDGAPTAALHSHEEALRTPGVVATFFYRLLERTNAAYPQRYMLWFTNYEDANVVHAKVLYALSRTPGAGELSAQHFVETYAETFPTEAEMIRSLAREVFGQSPSAAATIPSGSR
jgi:hypothetical protein